jgi:hypothetical protein
MTGAPVGGVKACVFDAYGTVFDFASAAAHCTDALGEAADRLTAHGATNSCNTPGCARRKAGMPISGR